MMSLETVEYFFGVSQDLFRDEFADRGFKIYPDAQLNAGFTRAAAAALFSPEFYDIFFGELMAQVETEFTYQRRAIVDRRWSQAGLTWEDIQLNFELLTALINRGYEIELLQYSNEHFIHKSMEDLSRNDHVDNEDRITAILNNSRDLQELLNQTTPLRLSLTRERYDRMNAVEEQQRNSSQPRFVVDLYDIKWGDMSEDVWRQVAGARYALDFSDTLLADNPDAIIIIQGDHGPIHSSAAQNRMLSQGYSVEQVFKQLHSVFSAVRIPEKYSGLDEPLAPLNISRELVNRFVGQNYALLP
jgi:hypothetical protein